jgi:PAS domain S-box-containing protein
MYAWARDSPRLKTMNYISILHFASLTAYLLLIVYVLGKRSGARLNRVCTLLIFSLALVSLSYGLVSSVGNPGSATIFVNLGVIGLCCGPMLALWFYLSLANADKILKNKAFIVFSILLPLAFICLQWSGNPAAVLEKTNWGIAIIWPMSPLAYAYIAYGLLLFILCGLSILQLALKARTPRQRKQAVLLFTTGAVSVISATSAELGIYLSGVRNLPQVPDILLLIWVIGIVLAVSKYGLMRITPVLASDEILGTMNDSLMLVNNEGTIVFANSATCSLLGISNGDITGKNFSSLVGDRAEADKLLYATRINGAAHCELNYLSQNGTATPVLVSTSAICQLDNEIAGFVVSASDMTRQKLAMVKLAEHQRLINGIIDSMPSAVLVIDGNSDIVLANRLFYQCWNTISGNVQGRPLKEIIASAELAQRVAASQAIPDQNSQLEFRYNLNGGGRIFVAKILSMPSENQTLLVLNDVTDEREKQDRLYLTDRLASVGEMAAGIAHEMNNPLTSVLGLSKMLLEEDLPKECLEDVNIIYSEAARVSEVVRNLLIFARKRPAVRQPAQLHGMIDDILRLRSYEHKINNIAVSRNFADDLPEVTVDYSQIQQVFINIILNAEYEMVRANKGGVLTITTKKYADRITVSFSDDGPGLSPRDLNRMFDPFFTTKAAGKGTGLGLSVSYGIVTNHGGKIYAASQPGKGATFSVELPFADPASGLALQAQLAGYLRNKPGAFKDYTSSSASTREN